MHDDPKVQMPEDITDPEVMKAEWNAHLRAVVEQMEEHVPLRARLIQLAKEADKYDYFRD